MMATDSEAARQPCAATLAPSPQRPQWPMSSQSALALDDRSTRKPAAWPPKQRMSLEGTENSVSRET